jgi:hypothetical protein
MFRRSIQLLAFGAVAAVTPLSGAAAADYCSPCMSVAYEQFYIVNHGPVYSGPGIVVAPAYFELDRWPATYPYIGHTYWYQPYDGGPAYEPSRHGMYHRRHVRHIRGPRPLDPRDK